MWLKVESCIIWNRRARSCTPHSKLLFQIEPANAQLLIVLILRKQFTCENRIHLLAAFFFNFSHCFL